MPHLQETINVIAALSGLLTVLGATLPQDWAVTKFCRLAAFDIKTILGRE